MMKKYGKLIVNLIIGCFILAGCAGKIELNEMLIVSAIGIDLEGDQTIVHLQVVNAGVTGSAQSEGMGGPVYTYSIQGKTLFDAINNANNILPREVIFSHITCFVMSEEYAREQGVAPLFDFMERNNEIRDNVLMFVAKDSTAKDILSLYTPIFKNPGESLNNRVKISSTSTGISEGIKVKEVVTWTYGEFRDPVVQGVERLGENEMGGNTAILESIDANSKTFNITGLALFKKEHFTDWYTYDQTLGWSILNSRIKELFTVTTECENQKGSLGFIVKNSKSTVKPKVENGEITYQINVTGTAVLQEITCDLDVSNPKTLLDLEEQVEQSIKQDVESAIDKAKELEIDPFGFGKLLFDKDPKMWKENYEKEWGEKFSNVNVNTTVSIRLESLGTKVKTIHEEE